MAVDSFAVCCLAGFWSGILPCTLNDDAQITGFGNIIADLLIVSLGTTIDFTELRRQWKVVVTALCGVCGAVAAIVLIGQPFIGSEMAIAGAPIFVAYQYAGSACINNTITGGAPLVAICPVALGPCIVIMFVCKLIGANIVRLILRAKRGKA